MRRRLAALLGVIVGVVRLLRRSGIARQVRIRGVMAFLRALPRARSLAQHVMRWHAFNQPDATAVVCGSVRLSYRELDERILKLAQALSRCGVSPGDKVALMLGNGPAFLEAQTALHHLRATAVLVGCRLKAAEVAYLFGHSGAMLCVHDAALTDVVVAAARSAGAPRPDALIAVGGPDVKGEYERILAAEPVPAGPPRLTRRAHAGLMIYTSGTTGRPKGATRDLQRPGIGPVLSLLGQLPLGPGERHLIVSPLYHSTAQMLAAVTFLVGGTVVLADDLAPEALLATIERERITSAMMVPTLYARLCALPGDVRARHDVSSLRWLLSGAAPLPTALAARIEETFGRLLYNFYGATETGVVTLARPGEHTARPGTIGRALGGVEIRLLDAEGGDVPPGQVGEIWVRSAMQVSGYHADDAATHASRRDGFFTVGDLGRRDAEGYYYLADRKHDLVISGGVNLYPAEIEEELFAHPAVLDCAVVGVPDPEWGEALCAFIVPRPGQLLSAADVRVHLGARLAGYKKPKHVVLVDSLPRTPTGKVPKHDLRAAWIDGEAAARSA